MLIKMNAMQNFELINGIKFTLREIEVISCIICGGSAKSISLILGISTNTVNSHIKNIILKIKGSSKSSIIKFIENSSYYFQMQKKYIDLISVNEFEKVLSQLNLLILKKIKCEIFVASGSANINLLIKKHISIIENLDIKIKILDELGKSCQKSENIFIFSETQDLFDYFKTFLQIIDSLYKCIEVQNITSNFLLSLKKRYSTYSMSINNHVNNYTFNKKNYMALFSLIIVCLIVIATLLALYKNQNWITNEIHSNIKQMPENFINRHVLQNKIQEIMINNKNEIKIIVLTGSGGAGKTTLARSFMLNKNSDIVWEINAETEYNMANSFLNLANSLCNTSEKREFLDGIKFVNDFNERKKRIINFVFKELKHNGNWCLLFDNVENLESIKNSIPSNSKICGSGTVIITTRNEILANSIYFKQSDIVNVGLLSKEEQLDLFCKIMYGAKKNTLSDKLIEIKNLLQTIPMMPLDVVTAAYYIKNTNTKFENYTSNISFVDRKINDLQKNFLSECAEYKKTRYDIIKVSFDNIIKVDAKFTELLLFICLVDPQNITKKLLNMLADPVIVDKFIYELKKQSLISSYENETFGVHRSLQEVGLNYMLTSLGKEEKTKYIDQIIKTMTPYENLMWIWYPSQSLKMDAKDRSELLPHLEALLQKLKKSIYSKKLEEDKLKILLSILYACDGTRSYTYMAKIAEEILRLNKNNNYIKNSDFISLLLEYIYDCFSSDSAHLIKDALDGCINLCNQTKNSEYARAICLAFYGRYYFCCGDEKNGLKFFNESMYCLKNLTCKNCNAAQAMVCDQLYRAFGNYYINKKNTYIAINFLLETLDVLEARKFFYESSEEITKVPHHVLTLRLHLSRAYNKVGQYEKSLANEKEAYFLYNKYIELTGFNHLSKKAEIDKEYGQTLLRKNSIKEAHDMFSKSINLISQIGEKSELFYALAYRGEANIRLNKLNEGYSDCINALKIAGKEQIKMHYRCMMEIVCLYNMSIIKHKQKNYDLSMNHINEFMKKANEFCLSFLDKDIYKRMVNKNIFKCATNQDDLTRALKNCEIIFSAIYGENHSFVKDYVAKNLTN